MLLLVTMLPAPDTGICCRACTVLKKVAHGAVAAGQPLHRFRVDGHPAAADGGYVHNVPAAVQDVG